MLTQGAQPDHRPWHAATSDEALTSLDASRRGLNEAEAAVRRQTYGPNELPRPQRASSVRVYLRQFRSPLIYLLLAAAVISLIITEFADAAFIFAVLQINAVIGAVQEWKAETSAKALGAMIRSLVVARRAGERVQVDSADLVPGDIVLVESGMRVPADLRLLRARELKVDEALLTGESIPVGKDAEVVLEARAGVGERRNMLHAGTVTVSGRAEGVATQTGLHTEFGRIAQVLAGARSAPPPLLVRLEKFTRAIGYIVVGVVALLSVAELLRGVDPAEIFFVAVALAVSAIPEGLPVAITVALSVGTARMARRNVIVRALPAVEGLGSCTLIASDKTGTLTLNELTIKRVFLPGVGDLDVGGEGYSPEGEVTVDAAPLEATAATRLRRLAVTGVLCNEAAVQPVEGGCRHFGDTVDVAFLVFALKLGLKRRALLHDHPELDAVPYEPTKRFAATINKSTKVPVAHVKGAAEIVLPMCAGIDREAMLAESDRLASEGYRVLAAATGPLPEGRTPREVAEFQGLEFLGFVGLIDPLRPEVPTAVAQARLAGVDVCMVTGDHPATAAAISRELGLTRDTDEVVTGERYAALTADPAQLDETVHAARIFARVEPVQKLTIVQSLQRAGHFVAVTGDGVNDAPALRAANIGVAMGRHGTDVARGAADLILTDDNFASIVAGIEEGRIAYDNVRKVVYLLVATGAAEVVLFFLALISGLPLPLFAVQLLWLNLVTNGIQDVALAFEEGEPGALKRTPRPPGQAIFDRRMIEQTVISGGFIGLTAFAFFWWGLSSGMSEFEARSTLLLLMVLFENVHAFNCRSEVRSIARVPFTDNPFLVLAVVCAQGVHIGAMFTPGLREVLRIEPITIETWLAILPLALSLVVVMEIYKFLRRRNGEM